MTACQTASLTLDLVDFFLADAFDDGRLFLASKRDQKTEK